jgi:hypothetical protein
MPAWIDEPAAPCEERYICSPDVEAHPGADRTELAAAMIH